MTTERKDSISGFGDASPGTGARTHCRCSRKFCDCRICRRADGRRIRTRIRHVLRREILRRSSERHRRGAVRADGGRRPARATSSLRCRTRLSPRPKRFRQAGARPDFVDIDEQHVFDGPVQACENISKANAIWIRKPGEPFNRKHQGACDGGGARAYLRAVRGHGSDSGIGAAVQTNCRRRRLPGAWRGIFLTRRESLEKGWLDGARRGAFSFYPGKESWRVRRSRSSNDERRSMAQEDAHDCAITAKRRSIITTWKDITAGWMRFRRGC